MAAELRILMVCMGNICRSPTAEGVLRARLEARGLARRVEVDSAGTHGYHVGEPPDARARKHAAARGYDLSKLRARGVADDDYRRFDWILAMDQNNLGWLEANVPPDGRARLALLLAHAQEEGPREVPDPYYGPPAGFDHVLDLVERACDGLVDAIERELAKA